MSLAVVGTGTDIGKTIACAVLLTRYASLHKLAYWKPIATGSGQGRDTQLIQELCGHLVEVLEEDHLFEPPVSPHLAARWEGKQIRSQDLVARLRGYRRRTDGPALLVEGIGGLLVPINDQGNLLADLLGEMELTCLLVASSQLGTINHTLLSLEALRSRNLNLAGVVLNGIPNPDNREAIESFGRVKVVGEIEPMNPLSRDTLCEAAQQIDRKGILEPYFQES